MATLKEQYKTTIAPALKEQLGVKNLLQVPVITNEDQSFELLVSHLQILDLDNTVDELRLLIGKGDNYSFDSSTIIPKKDFNGFLSIPIQVVDNNDTSNTFLALSKCSLSLSG